MTLSRRLRLIRNNIANAWAMLFQATPVDDDETVWPKRSAAVPEIAAD
jgi:hypothetical protein